ncbi:MAG: MarC family protein [Gaiellaceae bacterium]|jgi:MarC family membrane protein
MDAKTWDVYVVIDLFLLLLIGIGPKIALVPFLELTKGMDDKTRASVTRKMLTTAAVVAVVLVVLGELLRRLLHFSTGALGIAGGLVLVIIAVSMILSSGDPDTHRGLQGKDPAQLAVFPLAVPYLLNPAGIVVLVTESAEAGSVGHLAVVLGLLALVLAIDVAVFRGANRISAHVDESRMLVTEKVFGFLLAALAVQLALNGLDDLGLIHLAAH